MFRFIVVEGLIGVGKTTSVVFGQRMNGSMLEPAEDKSILASFYMTPIALLFLLRCFISLLDVNSNQAAASSTFSDLYVSDYLFTEDRLFAEQTLSGEEFVLYERFSHLLSQSLTDLVLFLDSPTDVILNRIKETCFPPNK